MSKEHTPSFPRSCVGMQTETNPAQGMDSHAGAWEPEIKTLVPRLRFPEFQDAGEWEENILSQVADYENGKAHEQDIAESGEFIVVNSKFISTDGEVRKFTNSTNLLAKKDDILMVLSDVPNGRAIAKCFIVDADNRYTVNQRICKLTSNNANSILVFYSLNRNPYFLAFDDGVKQTNLRKYDVLNCPILLPSEPEEQKKIANCLSSIDDLITAQAKKIEAFKAHKKGLMQQLFPREGETVPRLRFPEFNANWRDSHLIDIAEFIDSLHETPKQYVESGYPMIRVADVKDKGLDLNACLKVTEDIYVHFTKRYKPQLGDIIFSRVGTCGESVLINFKNDICLGQNTVLIKPKENSLFLFSYLKSNLIKDQVSRKTVGSSHKTLSLKDAKRFDIQLPCEKEQQKIANCLSSIDDLITAQAQKIETLKAHKKGLMQQLFPSSDKAGA